MYAFRINKLRFHPWFGVFIAIKVEHGFNISFKRQVSAKEKSHETGENLIDTADVTEPVHKLVYLARMHNVININSEKDSGNLGSQFCFFCTSDPARGVISLNIKCITVEECDVKELVLF